MSMPIWLPSIKTFHDSLHGKSLESSIDARYLVELVFQDDAKTVVETSSCSAIIYQARESILVPQGFLMAQFLQKL